MRKTATTQYYVTKDYAFYCEVVQISKNEAAVTWYYYCDMKLFTKIEHVIKKSKEPGKHIQ